MVDHNSNENRGRNKTEMDDDIYLRDKNGDKKENENDNRLSQDENEEAADTQTRSNIHLKTYESDGKGESTPESQVDEAAVHDKQVYATDDELASQLEKISPEAGSSETSSSGGDSSENTPQNGKDSSGRATEEIQFSRQSVENNDIRVNVQDDVEKPGPNDVLQSQGIGALRRAGETEEETAQEDTTVAEQEGNTTSANVVEENNSSPTAVDDTGSGEEDSVISGNVLTNDSDVDGTITVQNAGTFNTDHGSITINTDGSYEYTPNADYNGSDSFDVTIVDNDGSTSTSMLNLTVTNVNDGPVVESVELEEVTNSLSLNQDDGTGQVAAISGLDDFPSDAITVQINFSSDHPPQASETNGISLVSYATSGSNNEFLLFAEPSGTVSAYINGQRTPLDVGSNDLFDGESHDLAVSWDSGTGEVSIYVDGTLTDTAIGSTGQPLATGGTLVLGQEQDNVGGGFQSIQEFSGEFHSIEVFSEVRTAEEIAADIGKAPESGESTLVLGFDFNGDAPLDNLSGDQMFELNGGANVTDYSAGTAEEDSSGITGQILASDLDGDDLSYSITSDPSEGSVSIEADGSFHFTPGGGFQDLGVGESREVSFEVEVSDGNGGIDTQNVTVTVVGQNDGPTAEALAVETNEDNGVNGQLIASDIEGDDLSFSVNEQPNEGSVIINADGSFSFSPDNDFQDLSAGESRETSFSYEVSDNNGGSSIETVTVTVNGTNDAPEIGNITNVVGSIDEAESIAGMAMSFNEDGRSGDVAMVQNMNEFPTEELTVELRFSSTEAPDASETNGVSLFSYNTPGGENEFLLFSEPSGSLGVFINGQRTAMDVDMNSLFDGDYHHVAVSWDSGSGEISVYIDGDLEDTATAQAGNPIQSGGTLALGQEQDGLGGGFASNQEFSGKIADVQIFNEVRDADLIETDAATGGTATDDDSMVHAYDFRQSDDSSVTDQGAGTDMSYSGSVMVEDAGLPAQMGEVELVAVEDGSSVTGSLNASDVEGDDLTFSLVEGPTEGSVSISDDGQFEFDPGADFQELAEGETTEVNFTYQVDDGNGGVDSAIATVTVTGSNDGPVATVDSVSGAEDSVISGNVLTNDTDIEGDALSVADTGTFDTDHGSITINSDGSFEYTPDENYSGSDSFEYTVTDGTAQTTGTIDIDVSAVADGANLNVSTANITLGTSNVIEGTGGNNTIHGTSGSDIIYGNGGNDTIYGNGADDDSSTFTGAIDIELSAIDNDGSETAHVVISNVPEDASFSSGTELENGDWQFDADDLDGLTITVPAGAEDFDLSVSAVSVESSNSDQASASQNIHVSVEESGDVIVGGDGYDTLRGGSGNDTFEIGIGDDFDDFDGGAGTDTIVATEDGVTIGINTHFNPADSIEEISANGHSDVSIAGDGSNNNMDFSETTLTNIDSIDGGSGHDTITGSSGDDVISGGSGTDTLVLEGNQDEYIITDNGDNTYTVKDTVSDRSGTDTVDSFENLRFADGTVDIETAVAESPADNASVLSINDVTVVENPTLNDGNVHTVVSGEIASLDGETSVDHWQIDHNGGGLELDILSGGSGLDSMISIYQDNGDGTYTYVAGNDDASSGQGGDDGSSSGLDSYLAVPDLSEGNYVVVVGSYPLGNGDALDTSSPYPNVLSDTSGGYELTVKGDAEVTGIAENPDAPGESWGDVNDAATVVSVDGEVSGFDTVEMTFTVTLDEAPTDGPITVDYSTVDGSATAADGDYEASSGTVTFAEGETSKTITITVNSDDVAEGTESFSIELSNLTGDATFDPSANSNSEGISVVGTIEEPNIIEGTEDLSSGTINLDNFSSTDQGFTVTAKNIEGGELTEASSANISTYSSGGFGAGGTVSDVLSGVHQQTAYDLDSGISEQLIVDFDHDVSSADFTFNYLREAQGESAHWQTFKDGELVDEGDFSAATNGHSGTVTIDTGDTFDQLVFTGLEEEDGADGSDFMISEVNFTTVSNDGNDVIEGTSGNDHISGLSGNDTINGAEGADVIIGGDGNDTINGGAGDDELIGGDGSDTLTFLAHQGNDVVDGGEGGSWTDTLELSGFEGQGSEDGWTLSLNDGSSVTSTDELDGEMILSGDAGGTITFDDGGSVDFENIEKIVW